MACSEARLAANRANALKSTGPKTGEGKAASRRNALKHGLTGAGVVVPGEDVEEIRRQEAALLAELAPDGQPTALLLAERVATLAVRLKRSARHEFAATASRAKLAALDFDEARRAEAGRLFEAIDEGTNREDLLAMPEGLDLLVAALDEIRAVAAAGVPSRWSREDSARLVRCLPLDVRDHAEALGKALVDGDLSGLDRALVAIMDPANVRGPWALDQVVGLVEAERDYLDSLRAGLDRAAIDRLRVEAVDLALVDAQPETLLARKYEAATERALFRALREIRAARKPEPAPAPVPKPSGPEQPAHLVRPTEGRRRLPTGLPSGGIGEPLPPMGSIFPAILGRPASDLGSKDVDAGPAPRGRSRFEDKRKRPKLGR